MFRFTPPKGQHPIGVGSSQPPILSLGDKSITHPCNNSADADFVVHSTTSVEGTAGVTTSRRKYSFLWRSVDFSFWTVLKFGLKIENTCSYSIPRSRDGRVQKQTLQTKEKEL